jgi:hypothetical protein
MRVILNAWMHSAFRPPPKNSRCPGGSNRGSSLTPYIQRGPNVLDHRLHAVAVPVPEVVDPWYDISSHEELSVY